MEAQHALTDVVTLVMEGLEHRGANLGTLASPMTAEAIAADIGLSSAPVHADDCESLLDVPDGPRDCTCYISALRAQRDSLAAALREIATHVGNLEDNLIAESFRRSARTALASLGEEVKR